MAAAPAAWIAYFHKGRTAVRAGDLGVARTHLDDAQTLTNGDILELQLLEAEILGAEGHITDAMTVLEGAARAFPDNHWPAIKLAQIAQKQDDHIGAAAYLNSALAHDPHCDIPILWLLEAETRLKLGDLDKAAIALKLLCTKHFDQPPLARHLTALAKLPGGAGLARDLFQQILSKAKDTSAIRYALACTLFAKGDVQDAITELELLNTGQETDIKVCITLIQAYRSSGQLDKEEICLEQALIADPLNPWVLRHLFGAYAHKADVKMQQQILDTIHDKVDHALSNELTTLMLLRTHNYTQALAMIRQSGPRRDTPEDARKLVTALLGTYQFRLGLRYLRLCLRRWPSAQALIGLNVTWRSKLGQLDDVTADIANLKDQLPSHILHAHQLMIQGFGNDLIGATNTYAKMRKNGQPMDQYRRILAKMIFNLADLDDLPKIFAQIGNPGAEGPLPLHRGGLPGMMAMELDFETQARANNGPYQSLDDWVRKRHQSSIPAIRLIDAWRAKSKRSSSSTSTIPNLIFQYWDQENRPDSIESMSASWRIPGFEHRMMSRRDAVHFLREKFAPEWLRAFTLAHNPAEESDLLRLCLLSHYGGVWADADDVLYDDLAKITQTGRGLILYREALGGALGNNVMASAAGHPAVKHAANLVRTALLQRGVEMTWSKTGPGVLTRAVALYIAQSGHEVARENLTVLPYCDVAKVVGMHNPVRYKSLQTYWENSASRPQSARLWDQALAGMTTP
ncbi:MAG: glycosyltransferase [Sulfitobacter sp.]